MDKMKLANSLSRLENLIPKAPPEGIKKPESGSAEGTTSFKDTFEKILSEMPSEGSQGAAKVGSTGTQNTVGQIAKDDAKNSLKFSNHAIERMQSRGIRYDSARLSQLDEAVKKAAAKGSKDTLVLMDDSAVIVSVKNKTVVTVMDKNNLKENVFTNIDSTIVI